MITKIKKPSEAVRLGTHEVLVKRDAQNHMVLCNREPLLLEDDTMLDYIDYWAHRSPNTVCMRERTPDGWSEISYKEFANRIKIIASHLGSLDISADKPLLIIAPNSINHALTAFAAMTIGVPVAQISVAYAMHGETFEQLKGVIGTVEPGAIYFSNTNFFTKAIEVLSEAYDMPFIASYSEAEGVTDIKDLPQISEEAVEAIRKTVNQDTIAKIMMTSGSTGKPKGVINTHRMMYSNQVALFQMWPFLQDMTPNLVDWLPWSHTFGGNVCVNITLFHGGTLTIDDGKPVPALIGRTIENICLIEPNIYFNVPAGIESLLDFFEENHHHARIFFSAVKVIFVAGAALPENTRNRMIELAVELVGHSPVMLAGWGSTETAPYSTCLNFKSDLSVNIGIPMPGTEIKLTPTQDKLALAVRGPNVMPGYWRNEAATAEVFDEEGFYSMGDAGRLVDPDNPSEGLVFEGRVSENFKLNSGTWVNVNNVRVAIVNTLKPHFLDAVVTGHDRSGIGLLLVPNMAHLATDYGLSEEQQNAAHLQTIDELIKKTTSLLNDYNEVNYSSSQRIVRFALLPSPPSIQKNEITDKGYLNQRALLANWSDLINKMHDAEKKRGIKFYAFEAS